MPRLVPDLSGHVEREFPRGVGKIVDGAAGALHGLQLADHDARDTLADRFAAREIGERRQPLLDLQLRDVPRAHPHEAILARELVVRDWSVHASPPHGNERLFSAECSTLARLDTGDAVADAAAPT